jgi:hypothetical protein
LARDQICVVSGNDEVQPNPKNGSQTQRIFFGEATLLQTHATHPCKILKRRPANYQRPANYPCTYTTVAHPRCKKHDAKRHVFDMLARSATCLHGAKRHVFQTAKRCVPKDPLSLRIRSSDSARAPRKVLFQCPDSSCRRTPPRNTNLLPRGPSG